MKIQIDNVIFPLDFTKDIFKLYKISNDNYVFYQFMYTDPQPVPTGKNPALFFHANFSKFKKHKNINILFQNPIVKIIED